MSDDWQSLCTGDLSIEEERVCIQFANGRHQWVNVETRVDGFLLTSFVVRGAVTRSMPDLPLHLWQRNRTTSLVGFRIDARDRVVGESHVPTVGLTPDEFNLYLRTIAEECDRLEWILTGRDIE